MPRQTPTSSPLPKHRRHPPDAGFTLVELLVVAVLLGLIGLLASGGVRFGSRAWEQVTGRMATEAAVSGTVDRLRRAVGNAVPDRRDPGGLRGGLEAGAEALSLRTRERGDLVDWSLRRETLSEGGQGLRLRRVLAGTAIVLNNPLSYTDPSGYSWFSSAWKKVSHWFHNNWKKLFNNAFLRQGLAIAVGIAMFSLLGPGGALAIGESFWAGTAAAAISGAASGAIRT